MYILHELMYKTKNLELYAFEDALLNYLDVIFIKPPIWEK